MNELLVKGLIDYLRHLEPGHGLDRWRYLPEVHAAWRALADEEIRRLDSSSFDSSKQSIDCVGEGRGIVTMAGGETYLPSVFFLLHQLKRTACKLPVEVWHLGEHEMDRTVQAMLEAQGAEVRDLSQTAGLRLVKGWEAKPACILASRFQEVIWIDADNAPIHNPQCLFDEAGYREHGSLFWPDFIHWMAHPRTQDGALMFKEVYPLFGVPQPSLVVPPGGDVAWLGMPLPSSDYEVCFESGQIVVDKVRCWRELALASWYCQHGDCYFEFVHGDKEAFHFAWKRLGTPYALTQRMPDYGEPHTTIQHDGQGRRFFEHRNHPAHKWRLGGNQASGDRKLQLEEVGVRCVAELARQWSGRLWDNEHPTAEEQRWMEELAGRTWHYHRVGADSRLMVLKGNRLIEQGSQESERRWSIYVKGNRPRLVISGEHGPTVFLNQDGDAWEGKGLTSDQILYRLEPAGKRLSLASEAAHGESNVSRITLNDFYSSTTKVRARPAQGTRVVGGALLDAPLADSRATHYPMLNGLSPSPSETDEVNDDGTTRGATAQRPMVLPRHLCSQPARLAAAGAGERPAPVALHVHPGQRRRDNEGGRVAGAGGDAGGAAAHVPDDERPSADRPLGGLLGVRLPAQ